jgi:predicted RNA binding protein YcfA (HicA-like mRNA interferase family)
MTPKAARVTTPEVIHAIEGLGFSLARQSGSHKIYKHSDDRRITVPFRAGKILHPKVYRSILQDLTPNHEELEKLF